MQIHALKYRRSLRLKDYDYSSAGAYFVTICSQNRQCLLGEIKHEEMILNEIGRIVLSGWNDLPIRFPTIDLDEFVIMPNHMHGIIVLGDNPNANRGGWVPPPKSSGGALPPQGEKIPPVGEGTSPLQKPKLGNIIAYFKYQTSKQINQIYGSPGHRIWQRNYYEHIIRSEKSLAKIREYIVHNPLQWELDSENIMADPNQRKKGEAAEKQFWEEVIGNS